MDFDTAKAQGEIEDILTKILEGILKDTAKEIGFKYDNGVLDLVLFGNDEKLTQFSINALQQLQNMAEEWAKDTKENYPDMTEQYE